MWKKLLSIFCSSTGSPDMGRILAFKTMTIFSGTFAYSVLHNHQIVSSWTDVGAGYAAVMGGCVLFIGGKEVAVAKATSMANGAVNGG